MATRFIDPLFHSFYYMQCARIFRTDEKVLADARLNVYYIMLEKVQSFSDGKYDLSRKDVEEIYFEQRGDAGEQMEELSITKRLVSTAKMMATHRSASGSVGRAGSIASRTSGLERKTSDASYATKKAESSYAPPSRVVAAPPPYTSTPSSSSITGVSGKKAPPPPPPLKPKPSYGAVKYATAIFDFEAQVSYCCVD